MTRDDIIRMAREAGLQEIYSACDEPNVRYAYENFDDELERFANLVAAAEREECANLLLLTDLSGLKSDPELQNFIANLLANYVAVIRARGQS